MGSQCDVNHQMVGAGLVLSVHSNNYAQVDSGLLLGGSHGEGSHGEGILDG